jgi:hypothetical protein
MFRFTMGAAPERNADDLLFSKNGRRLVRDSPDIGIVAAVVAEGLDLDQSRHEKIEEVGKMGHSGLSRE